MTVYSKGRYTNTTPYVRNGTLVFTRRNRVSFNKDRAKYYTVVLGDTMDGIAYNMYGSACLYWAIMDANPAYSSELDMKPGDVIVIPSKDEVVSNCG